MKNCVVWCGMRERFVAGEVVGVKSGSEVVGENGFSDVGEKGIPECGAENGTLENLVVESKGLGVCALYDDSCSAGLEVGVEEAEVVGVEAGVGEFSEKKDGVDVIKSTCNVGEEDCDFVVGVEGE